MPYNRLALITGGSLFPDHSALEADKSTLFFMAEDFGMCTSFKYHKHKLVLLLSSMRSHRDLLLKSHTIEYFELKGGDEDIPYEEKLSSAIEKHSIKEIVSYEIQSRSFKKRLVDYCKGKQLNLVFKDSPGFLTTNRSYAKFQESLNKPIMRDFYKWQRRRLNLLLNDDGGPLNGKWSFDDENRKKLPKNIEIPELPQTYRTKNTDEVCRLVEELFPDNPGSTENFYLPTTRDQALEWAQDFFNNRLTNFGPYEDAISKESGPLFHSLLSPLLNIGLLTPSELISRVMEYQKRGSVPYQSLEGFVRQIIGWREFIRCIYATQDLRGNYFRHKRKLTDKWYRGETGLQPLDSVIKSVVKNSYAHHIERLMILSNLMLLCEIDPEEVYIWFMELFVDSAHWVMEPNVYAMGQFSDGGTITTKPYICGSNYILKMSDFKKGDWCDIWDGLYWRFIDKKRELISKNHRMSMMVSMFDKMDQEKKVRILALADNFIKDVTR